MFKGCIYFNLSTLTRKISKLWQNEFTVLGLSPSHGYLLTAIAATPDATQKILSEIMELDASTINRFIDNLFTKKLIKKNGTGRGANFTLTTTGIEVTEKIETITDNLFAEMRDTFGKRHLKDFVGNIHQARQTLEKRQKV